MEPTTFTLPGLNHFFSILLSPASTHDTIIFPYSSGSQKFFRSKDSIPQEKASDINDVLNLLEIALSTIDSSRKFFLMLFFPIFIPSIMLMNEFGSDYWVVGNLQFIHLIFISIIVISALSQRMHQMKRIKTDIQMVLEMVQPAFAKRGLTWHFSEGFLCNWLELRKESSTDEQNSTLHVEVHSDLNPESFMDQQESHCRIFEEVTDGENFIKNRIDSDLLPPVQLQWISYFVIYACIMLCVVMSM